MIRFNSIYIKNFLSIEEVEFQFLPGKHIVLGKNQDSISTSSNGSGKSSLFEAIPYVLYRDYPRKDVCRRGQKDCTVTLNVTINNKEYIISRYLNHSTKSGVEIIVDGENVTSKGIRQTEKEILSAIGLPYNLFTSSVIIPQGYPVNISVMTPTVRKSIIESLLGLLIWEDYQNIFSAVSKEYESKMLSVSSDFNNKKDEMVALYNQIKGLKQFTDEHLTEIKSNITAIKSEISNLHTEEDNINKKIEELSTSSIDSLTKESASILSSISTLSMKKADIERSIASHKCYVCNRPYSDADVEKMKSDIQLLEKKIAVFTSSSEDIKATISKIQELIYLRTSTIKKREVKNQQLQELILSYKKYVSNDKISDMEEKLDALTEDVNCAKDDLELVEREKNNVSFICSSLLPSSKFRTKLVGSYIQVLNQIIEDVTSLISQEFQISLVSSTNEAGIDISIVDNNGGKINYYSLSGGEKRRIDVILTLSIQKFLLESSFTDSNILIFDEIFDNLDEVASNTVLNAISNIFGEDKGIFVISHNDSVKALFESSIIAEKYQGVTSYDLENYF